MRDILNHCNVPYCTQITLKYLTYVQHLFYVNNACKKGQFKVIKVLINKQFKAFLRYQFECLTCEWNDSFWFLRKCTVIGSKLQMNVSWIQSKWHFQACSLYSYNKCNHRNAGAMRCILQKKLFASATLHFSPKDLLHKLDFFVGFFFGKVLITYIAFWQFRRCQIHCWMYRRKIRWYPYPSLFCQLRCRCRCEGGQKQVWRKEKSRQKSTFVKKNPWFSNF